MKCWTYEDDTNIYNMCYYNNITSEFSEQIADLPRSHLTLVRHEISDMLHCAICLNYATDPRYLPCLHTFCLVCILGCYKGATDQGQHPIHQIKCPECRQISDAPTDGLDKLPSDLNMEKLQILMERQLTLQVYH